MEPCRDIDRVRIFDGAGCAAGRYLHPLVVVSSFRSKGFTLPYPGMWRGRSMQPNQSVTVVVVVYIGIY